MKSDSRVISIFQPALANGHVDRENCISHRRFRSRTLVEGLFSFVFFSIVNSRDPFVEPPLRQGEATIRSRRRRLEAWDAPDIISRQYRRQEGIRAFFRAFQKAYTVSHIRSVRVVPFYCGLEVFNMRLYHRLDPVQVTQMAKYLETVYVSGWQSSSTASSTNEPGPDLAGNVCVYCLSRG